MGRVLIIDDEPGIRNALVRVLQAHDVVDVGAGDEACALLSEGAEFDVILCDMMMPGMLGMDVHLWVLEHRPELAARVIFITGGAFLPLVREYLESVPNPQLSKPFRIATVRKLVEDGIRACRSEASG